MFGKFGRYTPGTIEFDPERFELVAALREDVEFVVRDDAGVHRMRFDADTERHTVYTDRRHLRYIVVNLLQNAVKYSPAGSAIEMRLAVRAPQPMFFVRDAGIGIPAGEIDKLFSPLYRATNVGTRPGTGMGLAVVKRSARAIGARIDVSSTLGTGTAFTVHLPVAEAAAMEHAGRRYARARE